MHLENLKLNSFSKVSDRIKYYEDGYNCNVVLYESQNHYYKLWDKEYANRRLVNRKGNQYKQYLNSSLLGFDLKLYNKKFASAFSGYIHDKQGILRGYRTHKGRMVDRYFEPDGNNRKDFLEFLESFWWHCIKIGWIPGDICHNNLIYINGTFSLIDYDTDLTSLKNLNKKAEINLGGLRQHIYPAWRGFIIGYLSHRDYLKNSPNSSNSRRG